MIKHFSFMVQLVLHCSRAAIALRPSLLTAHFTLGKFSTSSVNAVRYTIIEDNEAVEIVKKSKFISRAHPATTMSEALQFVKSISDPKASHNCWAFRGISYERFTDDGEPSGTAGRPILNAIESCNLHNVVVVVTRYFGGTKLGTGGLIRSYFLAAQSVLKCSERVEMVATTLIRISAPVEEIGSLHQIVLFFNSQISFAIKRISETYDDDNGEVTLLLRVPSSITLQMQERLVDLCKGKSRYEEVSECNDIIDLTN